MCSTRQSRAPKRLFERLRGAHMPCSRCCRKQQARGFVFIYEDFPGTRLASRGLALRGGEFLENASRDFLQFSETRQVVLKVMVQELRVLRAELVAQNHVAQFHWMREQRLFLQSSSATLTS